MADLAAWLLAQIAEDERVCRLGQPYTTREDRFPDDLPETDEGWAKLSEMEETHTLAIHTAQCGYSMLEMSGDCTCGVPARVLAECAAKRGIVELHGHQTERMVDGPIEACTECGSTDDSPVDWPCRTLRLLAQPYVSRPGFDPAWKVET